MRIVYNRFVPFKGYVAMCVGNIVFIRYGVRLSASIVRHESIHGEQWKECLYVFFLPIYILSFVWQFVECRDFHAAYRSVCFEKEAYAHEREKNYLSKRRRFAWLRRNK